MNMEQGLARPWATAIFNRAVETGQLDKWDQTLQVLGQVIDSPAWRRIAADARIGHSKQAEILSEACGGQLDQEGLNLVKLLAAFNRIGLVHEIHRQVLSQKDLRDGVVEIELTMAIVETLDESKLLTGLKKRFGPQLRLVRKTDPKIIGGVVLRQGDRVIDGSLKGGLERIGRHLRV